MSTQSIELARPVPPLTPVRPTYLMCAPDLYEVAYVINPWMTNHLHNSSQERAAAQWRNLYRILTALVDVELIEPRRGSPDMVFTANAGLERNGVVVLSSFLYPERQAEEQHFSRWFRSAAYTVVDPGRDTPFEGEGDALFSEDGSRLWAGYGPRTSRQSHPLLAQAFGIEVAPLNLVDPRFYHLDTCFAPLTDGLVLYYPQAFDAASRASIEAWYPPEKRIAVTEADAACFACNAINIGRNIILNNISRELTAQLQAVGFRVIQITLTEFIKAGGAAKCLVMRLGQPPRHNEEAATKSEGAVSPGPSLPTDLS